RPELDLVRVGGIGRSEELSQRVECRSARDPRRKEEDPVPEDVERVEERERLKIGADGEDVLSPDQTHVVGELPHVLIQNIVNREWLVPYRRVRDARLADLDRGEILAERLAEVPEPVVAREEAVRQAPGAAIELQRERMQVVVDRVARLVERQAALVRAPAGVVEAQHE